MTDESKIDPLLIQLFELGKPRGSMVSDYLNYIGMGIRGGHVHDLIRIIKDYELYGFPPDNPAAWAPLHAWRAIGQMKIGGASQDLTDLFHEMPDNEWVFKELPIVFGLIGLAAIPALKNYIADSTKSDDARSMAIDCLGKIGKLYDAARAEVTALFNSYLEFGENNSPFFNAAIVLELVNMKAVDSWSLIEKAINANHVDTEITGNADMLQVRLGLKQPVLQPQSPDKTVRPKSAVPVDPQHAKELEKKARAKRKQESKSRKQNRKK
jgi:hypothetical protein